MRGIGPIDVSLFFVGGVFVMDGAGFVAGFGGFLVGLGVFAIALAATDFP